MSIWCVSRDSGVTGVFFPVCCAYVHAQFQGRLVAVAGGEPDTQPDRVRRFRSDRCHTPVVQCPLVSAPIAGAGVVRSDPIAGQIVVEQLVHVLEDEHVGVEHADALIAQTVGHITG